MILSRLSQLTDMTSYVTTETLVGQGAATPATGAESKDTGSQPYRQRYILWRLAFASSATLVSIYGLYLCVFHAKWPTVFFFAFLHAFALMGVNAGAHRLWTHRAYKAKWPLRLLLAAGQTISLQYPILVWVRMHRVHHKYSETDADRHNARRGFFYSHVGWLLMDEHPEYQRRLKEVDDSDLLADPIVAFQDKYFVHSVIMVILVPMFIPWYFWAESFFNVVPIWTFRAIFTLNMTFLVNSAAHKWGNHPYDRHISPTESHLASMLTLGEGWHNYHHVFPWDYKTSELGHYGWNNTTAFIDFFHRIGWAYDLKTVTDSVIRQRVLRTGDGTHPIAQHAD